MIDLSSTRALVKEAREKAGKATVGPWKPCARGSDTPEVLAPAPNFDGTGGRLVRLLMLMWPGHPVELTERAEELWYDTAEFIAASRTLVPALADATERLVEALEEALTSVEHSRCRYIVDKRDGVLFGTHWECCSDCPKAEALARVEQILKGEGK